VKIPSECGGYLIFSMLHAPDLRVYRKTMRNPQFWRKDGHFRGAEAWMRLRGQYVGWNPQFPLQTLVWHLNRLKHEWRHL